ncbi:MAG: hypothetical protein KIS66_14445 [Fimbriimonadaceae bacterium]|nr:hypothetical protein [Fimbriimonadaceae bacterium]
MRRLAPFALLLLCAGLSSAQMYRFSVNPAESGIDGAIEIALNLPGTLIGNYDAASNPTGTRTKPGILGTFGSTENVAVPVTVSGKVGGRTAGSLRTATSGTFVLDFDPAGLKVHALALELDLLNGQALEIPATLSLTESGFRTRNPTFTYLAGTLPIPIGTVVLSAFTARMGTPSQAGTMVHVSGNQYTYSIVVPVQIEATARIMGNEVQLPAQPFDMVLAGVVVLDGANASLSSQNTFTLEETRHPNTPVPPMAVDLPTFGDPAHVVMSLTIETQTTYFSGTATVQATGVRETTALVSAAVSFGDLGAGASTPGPVVFEVRQAGSLTVLYRRSVQLGVGGTGAFSLPLGAYDIALKHSHWLRRTLPIALGAAGANLAFPIVNGDVNGDNSVNIADYLILRAAFGSSSGAANWVLDADLDHSGSVGTNDFLILRRNFGRSGDR